MRFLNPCARAFAALASVLLSVLAVGCGAATEPGGPEGSSTQAGPSVTVTPGQSIWVAVLATADDAATLDGDLEAARVAVGDYLADRVVVKDASCFTGLPPEMDGSAVLAIQDRAEHGVHAMYEEITDAPPFYGPVTLAC